MNKKTQEDKREILTRKIQEICADVGHCISKSKTGLCEDDVSVGLCPIVIKALEEEKDS